LKLSFVTAACFIAATLVAASGCANKAADTNNAATSPATSNASQTTASGQSPATGQTNAAGATTNTIAGQPAPASATNGTNASGASRNVDACALLTSDDIKAVQGEAVKDTKPSRHDDASLQVSQCFYTTATFNKSVSLELTASADGKSARKIWDERFARAREESGKGEKEREREKRERDKKKTEPRGGGEEEEEGAPPAPIKGLGDEAYWASSRVNGTLYARKGDSFVRVSIGGSDDDATRQRKAKALAGRALARL
jgi:hypothetical protein